MASKPQIGTGSATVINTGEEVIVSITVTNVGSETASKVFLTGVTMGAARRISPQNFPVYIGNLTHEGSGSIGARFSNTGLTPGQQYLLTLRGTYEAGGTLAISPHLDPELVRHSVGLGLWTMPGVATVSEAFAALRAGAHALKAFPNDALPPEALRAWRTVLPEALIYPVGGMGLHNLAAYRRAGATGAGLGSAIYRAGDSASVVGERARELVQAWQTAER